MTIRDAVMGDAIKIARMLETALRAGWEGGFPINRKKLVDHVMKTIGSLDGFAVVLVDDDDSLIGCFLAEVTPHAYCDGYVVNELGSYIFPEHRGNKLFEEIFSAFLNWSKTRPDRIMTTFTIGQLNETTPYLQRILKEQGFTKVTEGYFRPNNCKNKEYKL